MHDYRQTKQDKTIIFIWGFIPSVVLTAFQEKIQYILVINYTVSLKCLASLSLPLKPLQGFLFIIQQTNEMSPIKLPTLWRLNVVFHQY